jgi:hypothetical protein
VLNPASIAKDAEDDSDDEHGGASVTRSGRAYHHRHAHRRRRFAIALCASDAVITNVDFSRTK